MKSIFYIIVMTLLMSACMNSKRTGIVYIRPKSILYRDTIIKGDTITFVYKIQSRCKCGFRTRAILEIDEDKKQIEIRPLISINLFKVDSLKIKRDTAKKELADGHYFPNDSIDLGCFKKFGKKTKGYRRQQDVLCCNTTHNIGYVSANRIAYTEVTRFAQGITIPFKIRPAATLYDGYHPYTVETEINAAFALGYKRKRNWVRFRTVVDDYGKLVPKSRKFHERSIDFSIGGFAGPTIQQIDSTNTKNSYKGERVIMGANYGLMAVAGLKSFNIGIAIGVDSYFGSLEKNYMYNNKPWFGLVLAFDFIEDK